MKLLSKGGTEDPGFISQLTYILTHVRVFEIVLEGGREWKFYLGELQSFVMLKATFSKQ